MRWTCRTLPALVGTIFYIGTTFGATGLNEVQLERRRERLHRMSDDELVRFVKAAQSLCRNRDCPQTFKNGNWKKHGKSGGAGTRRTSGGSNPVAEALIPGGKSS
jgi:hypothetical protein